MKIDRSIAGIVVANIITIILVISLQWEFSVVIWIYWIESLIIGGFTVLGFFLRGVRSDPLILLWNLFLGAFFIAHYGFFHLVYFPFLVFLARVDENQLLSIAIGAAFILLGHSISFLDNIINRKSKLLSRPSLMGIAIVQAFVPYMRIVPIHFTIFAIMFAGAPALLLGAMLGDMKLTVHAYYGILIITLMGLKTAGDVGAHTLKYHVLGILEDIK